MNALINFAFRVGHISCTSKDFLPTLVSSLSGRSELHRRLRKSKKPYAKGLRREDLSH